MSRVVRIGIDVGGTFTHAVAISQMETLVGKTKVPTSHRAPEGVARGIVEALALLLKENDIAAEDVSFIAHSTTQATNALLEGDVVKVGIIGMSSASLAPLARSATKLGRVPLASGIYLETEHRFITVAKELDEKLIDETIASLVAAGCGAIAVSEAFAVDSPQFELAVLERADRAKVLATAGSEVSRLYGLRVRTRTAAINAGILPKMIESANLTEESVRKAGIAAPIMIMRSDGGVMDIDAMRKRPILSILSGPAAGVAAAMMFLKISDGVFLEVGGTSTDISAIANGKALVRSAEIGGHKVYMRTLDVRTIGVAGGSMPRIAKTGIIDVGPRSAHIANLKYASFSESAEFTVETVKPLAKDPGDYLALSLAGALDKLTLTPTCAANLLGLVPEGDCAFGKKETIAAGFDALARHLALPAGDESRRELADKIEALATRKCVETVRALIKEHKLDPELTVLVGGGGGAAAIVPYLAKSMGLRASLAEHADVISAIGVAMALIRETIERQVANPGEASETILSMRQEVFEAVHRMGADPATIEVHVEIDSKTSVVRVTASGASHLAAERAVPVDEAEKMACAARSLRVEESALLKLAASSQFLVLGARLKKDLIKGLPLPFLSLERLALRAVDNTGVVRLQAMNGAARAASKATCESVITELIEEHSTWGDAGKTIPDIVLLAGAKIIDLSGLLNEMQVLTLARSEMASLADSSEVIVIAKF
jgi:N-methylhydantoinase A